MSKMDRCVEWARRFIVFRMCQPTGKKRTRCYNVAMKTGWVFLLDALLDGVMVTLALRLGGAKAPVWRIVLAALLGAAAARLCAGLPRGDAPCCGCRLRWA